MERLRLIRLYIRNECSSLGSTRAASLEHNRSNTVRSSYRPRTETTLTRGCLCSSIAKTIELFGDPTSLTNAGALRYLVILGAACIRYITSLMIGVVYTERSNQIGTRVLLQDGDTQPRAYRMLIRSLCTPATLDPIFRWIVLGDRMSYTQEQLPGPLVILCDRQSHSISQSIPDDRCVYSGRSQTQAKTHQSARPSPSQACTITNSHINGRK